MVHNMSEMEQLYLSFLIPFLSTCNLTEGYTNFHEKDNVIHPMLLRFWSRLSENQRYSRIEWSFCFPTMKDRYHGESGMK